MVNITIIFELPQQILLLICLIFCIGLNTYKASVASLELHMEGIGDAADAHELAFDFSFSLELFKRKMEMIFSFTAFEPNCLQKMIIFIKNCHSFGILQLRRYWFKIFRLLFIVFLSIITYYNTLLFTLGAD